MCLAEICHLQKRAIAAWKWCQERWLVTCAPKWSLQKDMGHDEEIQVYHQLQVVRKSIQDELKVETRHWRSQD